MNDLFTFFEKNTLRNIYYRSIVTNRLKKGWQVGTFIYFLSSSILTQCTTSTEKFQRDWF